MAYPTALYTVSGGVKQFWLGASGTKPDTTTGVYVAQMNQGNTVFNWADTAIDTCGGVHILWYDTIGDTPGSDVTIDVFTAFIDDFGLPTQTIDVAKLTDQPFSVGTMANPVFLGERQSLTLAQRGFGGLWQLACFTMVEDGLVNTSAQRVRTSNFCESDHGNDPPR
ncbi:hypothetical protein MNBD_PLANCTO03-99 [hydrothermal vent metagenome]|uniref:Uncharacterized protein n=1 Tax=hydrothermal vent metagenome TaxID=652676 RepID=A0A3B1DRJ4_9ZZZZ